ncbi:MAG TPA: penicillin-binding transpeptidase domain-containing protein [Solirubrobacteraceae bacterium]|nr:penicillin-binding transpeptidase domain-containing protein [Solirubrobacteraceae bacterium]
MKGPLDERTPPMTPQLALRVAIIGCFALVMFAVIFFRLWFLQVLSGSQYVQAAQVNIVRDVPVPAQRGEIVDRSGAALVESERVPAIQIAPDELPVHVTQANMIHQPAEDYPLYDKLARILRMSTKPHPCSFYTYGNGLPVHHSPRLAPIPCLIAQNVSQAEYANVTIKTDVSPDIQAYIAERQSQFPGVTYQEVYLRKYPLGAAGAQVFGTLGAISLAELNTKPYKGIRQGNIVGQSGLEYEYNSYLQGADGEDRVKVNSNGQFEGYAKYQAPTAGDNLKLSLDARLEQVGQQALEHSIAVHGGSGGAFVALNPQNGSVYAMGSAPSFNPTVFTKPISTAAYNRQFRAPAANDPLINRAIESTGATGSTFKLITATAALESGKWGVDEPYDDTGQFCFPGTNPPFCLHNSGHVANGAVSLVEALQVSDDVYFYHLGYIMNGNPLDYPRGWPLQKWAKAFGIGRPTGVDLPGEAPGTLPSPAWRAGRNAEEKQCDKASGSFRYSSPTGSLHASHKLASDWHRSPTHAPGGCGIANLQPWTVGDNVNTGVGQGDDQVSPLQLAVAYSTMANGGTVVTPHIGMQVQSPNGTVLQNIDPAPKRKLDINPAYRNAILEGLNQAAQSPGGTSYDVMGNFPKKVYGKTGTAQYGTAAQIASNTEADYAWYACFVPATATSKPITVVVWVPKGGFGDVAAAPVARQILNQWFYGKPGPYVTGTSTTL